MNVFFLAVQPDPFETVAPTVKAVGPAIREWLILMGAILVVAMIVLLWTLLSGKSRRHAERRRERHERRRSFNRHRSMPERKDKPSGRRRRRHHRPRNPTLAETGGLPPIRAENQESQFPPH